MIGVGVLDVDFIYDLTTENENQRVSFVNFQ